MKVIPQLARVLMLEGQVPVGDGAALYRSLLDQNLYAYAVVTGVYNASQLVVNYYRIAASKRQVQNGVNVNPESLERFDLFIRVCCENASGTFTGPVEVKALLLHNAASACAKHNGNHPERQDALNEEAYDLLSGVFEDYRGPAWWVVRTKIGVGLMESGAIAFNEGEYCQYLDFMRETQSKDHAGRVEFYMRWLVSQGNLDAAKARLTDWVRLLDIWSAPNQIERLRLFAEGELGMDIDNA
ncbi:MAG TPA: hypothetical protein DEP63_04080 [Candidatus Magasanikbacteria bacterium]|nr:hypothetical protein [Candidatus Magasanikbacteria bacterium]HCC13899.1 hypothetical protein [Candidatus Magasanikbacteria bacterium]HCM53383.1 hypothetical protein [Candidatus Magasanikbacteria bacterium]